MDRAAEHVFDLDFASSLGIKEEKELADTYYNIEWIERFCQLLKLRESRHHFKDIIL